MKYLLSIITIVALSLSITSCNDIMTGECSLIGFEKSHTFAKDGGNHIFKGERSVNFWFLSHLFINETELEWTDESLKCTYKDPAKPWTLYKIEGEWFVIERIDDLTISVTVTPTDQARNLSFLANQGNCSDPIEVFQII